MTEFMTSSFVKILFSLISNILVCFFRWSRMSYSIAHTASCEKRVYDINTRVYSC